MVIEKSGVDWWCWAGPKTSIPNIKREFKLWGFPFDRIQVEFFTYEGLVRVMDEWDGSATLPGFFVADESSRCKNATSQRSKACQKLADLIREKYGLERLRDRDVRHAVAQVARATGGASAKSLGPASSGRAARRRWKSGWPSWSSSNSTTATFKKRIGWKDDERKCAECGDTHEEGPHELDGVTDPDDYHEFVPSINEVAYLIRPAQGPGDRSNTRRTACTCPRSDTARSSASRPPASCEWPRPLSQRLPMPSPA